MSEKIEQFREFVKKYPKLKFEVSDKKRTWQNIYEDWVLLGEDDNLWKKYSDNNKTGYESVQGQETLRQIVDFIKKVNPDTLTNGLSTAQKVISLFQGFNNMNNNQQKLPYNNFNRDPLFGRISDWN